PETEGASCYRLTGDHRRVLPMLTFRKRALRQALAEHRRRDHHRVMGCVSGIGSRVVSRILGATCHASIMFDFMKTVAHPEGMEGRGDPGCCSRAKCPQHNFAVGHALTA